MSRIAAFLVCVGFLFPTLAFSQQQVGLTVAQQDKVVHLRTGDAGGTGVVVSDDGVLLTVKHCATEQQASATFSDGTVRQAVLLWSTSAPDGPAIYKLVQPVTGLPHAKVSTRPPYREESVYAVGFPHGSLSATSGKIVQTAKFQVANGAFMEHADGFPFNVGTFVSPPGFSGSPVFSEKTDEVVGLICASATSTNVPSTIMAGQHTLVEAMEVVNRFLRQPPTPRMQPKKQADLLVFTADWCQPCAAFKADFRKPHLKRQLEEKLNVMICDVNERKDLAKQYSITNVPTFVVVSGTTEVSRRVGYDGPDSLGIWLKSLDQEDGPTTGVPPFLLENQPEDYQTPPEGPSTSPIPNEQETPAEDESLGELDPEGLSLVVLFKQQGGHSAQDMVLGFTPAIMQRALENAFNGRATVKVVAERTAKSNYDAICEQMGVSPAYGHIYVLVPQSKQGIVKGLLVKAIEKAIHQKVGNSGLIVEPVFERTNAQSYYRLLELANSAPRSTFFGVLESHLLWVIGIVAALVGERLMSYVISIFLWIRSRLHGTQPAQEGTE